MPEDRDDVFKKRSWIWSRGPAKTPGRDNSRLLSRWLPTSRTRGAGIIRLGVVNGATWTPPREGNLGRRVLQIVAIWVDRERAENLHEAPLGPADFNALDGLLGAQSEVERGGRLEDMKPTLVVA